MNFDALKNTLVSALNEAGLNEYEIYYMSDESVSVSTLNKEVNSFSSSTSGGLCLRVAVEGRMGYASTELMTEAEMAELPARAKANALATEKLDTVIMTDAENIEVIQDDYKVKTVTVAGNDFKSYSIVTDLKNTASLDAAKALQENIYKKLGVWMPIKASADGEKYIEIKQKAMDKPDGM